MKKKVVAFTIADDNHQGQAKMLANSLRKFHTEEELPLLIYNPQAQAQKDPSLYYKATPLFAKDLLKEYETVIKLDSDQIITGRLDHLFIDPTFDVGVVLNWNRIDPKLYGLVQTHPIDPGQYYNCGLVVMRSEAFVKKWWELCQGPFFDRLQYREQDLLNYLCYFGSWTVLCFDYGPTWNGLISKGEWPRVRLEGEMLVVDPEPMEDGRLFPEQPKVIKVLHWAGGNSADKMNYRLAFNEEVIKRLDYLVSTNDQTKS